ncbi:hypothetical protein ABIF27_002522 [Bradyrhizobium elkanii]
MPNSAACLIELVVSSPALASPMILGLRALRLQQEGREVRRIERHADRADHLALLRHDDVAGVLFQRVAEGVVGGQEEPGVATRLRQRAAGPDGERAGVIGPVEAVGRAGIARDARGRRANHDVDLLLFLRQLLHRERDRRRRELGDHVDVLDLVPAPRDRGRKVRLVLMVGGNDLDLLSQHLAAEILDRHPRGFKRIFAAVVGIDAGLIVQDADLDALGHRRRRKHQAASRDRGQKSGLHFMLSQQFLSGKSARHYFITPRLPIDFRSAKSMGCVDSTCYFPVTPPQLPWAPRACPRSFPPRGCAPPCRRSA